MSEAEIDLADSVIADLRMLEAELRDQGVTQLSLFGSVARGEAHAESDVDLAAVFDKTARLSLIDVAGMELRLGEVLGRRVELLTLPIRNPYLRENIERDLRRVF